MGEFLKLVSESPLSVALVICASLAGVLYRILPALIEQRTARAQAQSGEPAEFTRAVLRRFEEHAKRVHDMAGTIGEARRCVADIAELERKLEAIASDNADMMQQVTEFRGVTREYVARMEELARRLERFDRQFERIQDTLDWLSQRLIGSQRAQREQ